MGRVLGGFAENQADFCHGFGVLCGFSPTLLKGNAADLGKRSALGAFQANSTCKTTQTIQRSNQHTTLSCTFPNHAPSQPTSRALCAARFRTVSATSPQRPLSVRRSVRRDASERATVHSRFRPQPAPHPRTPRPRAPTRPRTPCPRAPGSPYNERQPYAIARKAPP